MGVFWRTVADGVNRRPALACELLLLTAMAIERGPWLKLNPSTIASVPDAPGVYEIANLVRTVLFIGRGEGNLRRSLTSLGPVPSQLPASIGGYYVRYELVDDEERVAAERAASYVSRHGGCLPAGNAGIERRPVRLITRDAA